jgi:hypothetical protein
VVNKVVCKFWKIGNFLDRWLVNHSSYFITDILRIINRVEEGSWWARILFKKFKPSVLIISDDRSVMYAPGFLRIARKMNIISVAVPFGISSPHSDLQQRLKEKSLNISVSPNKWLKEIISKRAPDQCYSHKTERYLFLPLGVMFGLSLYRLLPKQPWCSNGGVADLACVFTIEEFINIKRMNKKNIDKYFFTGQCSIDELWKTYANRYHHKKIFFSKLKFSETKKLIVFAIPQHIEHGMMKKEEYINDIAHICDIISKYSVNVVASLHPRQKSDNYIRLLDNYNITILKQPLREVLPMADIFIATHSTTVQWAEMMGIPSIIIDYEELGDKIYGNKANIDIVHSNTEFSEKLFSLLKNDTICNDAETKYLEPFDGKVCERITQEIKKRYIRKSSFE